MFNILFECFFTMKFFTTNFLGFLTQYFNTNFLKMCLKNRVKQFDVKIFFVKNAVLKNVVLKMLC